MIMKEKINGFKFIIILVIGIIIGSSMSIYATYNYLVKDIKYTKQDGTEINVETALNDLYNSTNVQYNIIDKQNKLSPTYTYTIKQEDLSYKRIILIISAVNDSVSVYPARYTITNDNIKTLFNDDAYSYDDNGLHITNKIYIGYLDDITLNDNISVSGLYGCTIILVGVK